MGEEKGYGWLDHFLMRAKDVAFLLGIVGAFVVWFGNWGAIPARVEANTEEIRKIKDWEQKADTRLSLIDQNVQNIASQQNEMRQDIKTLLQRGR